MQKYPQGFLIHWYKRSSMLASGILVLELGIYWQEFGIQLRECIHILEPLSSSERKRDVQHWLQWASGGVRLGVNVKNLAQCPCLADRELTSLAALQVPPTPSLFPRCSCLWSHLALTSVLESFYWIWESRVAGVQGCWWVLRAAGRLYVSQLVRELGGLNVRIRKEKVFKA